VRRKAGEIIYHERLSSNKTLALFLALTIVFDLLFLWRLNDRGFDLLAVVYLAFGVFFLFYSINYRTLVIDLTPNVLKLSFGIFSWKVPLENVEDCTLDDMPVIMRMGGAGIHFMTIRRRYRASFNFLEHPRLVIAFKRKVGPVRDISFSTRRPDELLQLLKEAVSAKDPALN
jgi:hypothetical protein